jgi:2-oxoglutarate ferredoxin oxidoreductase subunit beta
MKFYKENSEIKNGADTREVGIAFKGKIICGRFIDRERPSYLDAMNEHLAKKIGASYQLYTGVL